MQLRYAVKRRSARGQLRRYQTLVGTTSDPYRPCPAAGILPDSAIVAGSSRVSVIAPRPDSLATTCHLRADRRGWAPETPALGTPMPATYTRHRAQLKAILRGWGMPEDNAEITAEVLAWSDLHLSLIHI